MERRCHYWSQTYTESTLKVGRWAAANVGYYTKVFISTRENCLKLRSPPPPPPRVKYYPVKSEDLKPLHETDNFWWHILRRCEIWVDVKDDTITTMPQKHWMMVFIFSAHFLFFSQPIITWRCNQLMVKLLLFVFFLFCFSKDLIPPAAIGLQHIVHIWANFQQSNTFKILNYTETSVQRVLTESVTWRQLQRSHVKPEQVWTALRCILKNTHLITQAYAPNPVVNTISKFDKRTDMT